MRNLVLKMDGPSGIALYSIALLYCLDEVISENPGFQTRITAAGLNYANQEAIVQLAKTVKGQMINIPPGESGGVSFSISNAQLTNFFPPSSSSLKPITGSGLITESGLTWSASNIGLDMRGNFDYSFKKGIIKFSDGGSFELSVPGVSFSVLANFGMDTTGRPSIRAGRCTSDIGKVSIKFHGRWAWAYNAFREQLGEKIQGLLRGKMCDLISRFLNTDAEKSLSLMKITVGIGNMLELNYKLTGPPNFTSDYMETYHKGEIDWKSAPAPPPFQAQPLPNWNDTSRMMYLWVSDFMMNSLFYQAQQHNLLSYNLTAQDSQMLENVSNLQIIPTSTKPSKADRSIINNIQEQGRLHINTMLSISSFKLPEISCGVLNTTCSSSLCIGNFIPALQENYPNCQVELRMNSTKMPLISVVNGSIQTNMTGSIAVYVQPMSTLSTLYFKPGENENHPEGNTRVPAKYVLTMDANMTLGGQISVVDQTMHYKITNMGMTVSLKTSTIPNISERALNFLINNAVETFIQPKIDDLGKKGIPLPLGKVALKNAKVVLLKDAFVIATDLVYQPDY